MKNIKYFILIIISFSNIPIISAQDWHELGVGINALNANNVISTTCVDNAGNVYAAGAFVNAAGFFYVAKWNGDSWSEVGFPDNSLNANGSITALCFDHAKGLYAAGCFSNADGKFYVARWNGSTWTELGTGANALNANACIDAICTDSAGNVYASGEFSNGATEFEGYRYVAKWNGTSWHSLGTWDVTINFDDGAIPTLTADKLGNIYAAGELRHSPGGYYYVARWNGATWEQLGTGSSALNANHPIWSLYCDEANNLYAGGYFTDTNSYYYVAKWDGAIWTELGADTNALRANDAILTINGDIAGNIYAAGGFNHSTLAYVSKWNGIIWSDAGIGSDGINANGTIFSLSTDNMGNVYAAGYFTDSVSILNGHQYVAKYNTAPALVPALQNSSSDIALFPNPTSGLVHIITAENYTGEQFYLFNAIGEIICKGQIKDNNTTTIDLSAYTPGNYFLKTGKKADFTYTITKW